MINRYKNIYVAMIIILQSVLGIFIGLLVFFLVTGKSIAPGVYIADISVSNMDRTEASKILQSRYNDILEKGSFNIIYNDKEKFTIKYSDINASLDIYQSVQQAMGKGENIFKYKFNGYFFHKKKHVNPIINFDDNKLKEKIKDLSRLTDRKDISANLDLIDGRIVKSKEVEGVRLNQENAYNKLINEIPENIGKDIRFNKGRDMEIEPQLPQFSLNDFTGADEIVAQYSTYIKASEYKKSIKAAVHAINKVVLFPKDIRRGLDGGTFSFNKYLDKDKILKADNDEGYNQVASTLNAAVLKSELDVGFITRTTHKSTVDYIDPGLDAVVKGSSIDYKFKNTAYSSVLVIFASVTDDRVVINLVGKKPDKKIQNELDIDIVQKYDPSIVNTESQDLKAGEKRLISPGKEGIKVNVYRVIKRQGVTPKKVLLFNNIKYDSIKSVIEIGRGQD